MGENEPRINLNIEGGDAVEARRDNTTLYTFLGALAMYDHVFIVTNEVSEEGQPGFYIFNDQEIFTPLTEFMYTNDFPMHLNMRKVAECDRDAHNRYIKQLCADIGTTVPENWG